MKKFGLESGNELQLNESVKIKKVATPRNNIHESIFSLHQMKESNDKIGALFNNKSRTPRHADQTFEFQENEQNIYNQLVNPDKIKAVASPRVL